MERIKSLNRFQKGVLLLLIAMVVLFGVIYARTIHRVGYAWQDTILVAREENGSTVYAGRYQGQPAAFTVSPDKTVVFAYGDKTYGPYTAKEDSGAIPKESDMADSMKGIELRKNGKIIFRGGLLKRGDMTMLYNEDGSMELGGVSFAVSSYGNSITMDENGNVIDPMEPSVYTILNLMDEPDLTHNGDWWGWVFGVFLSIVTAVSILFADELFRLKMSFRIQNAYQVEPSDFELAGRYIGWTVIPIMILVLFCTGLQ